MKIVYIHGLNSTHLSLTYISRSLPEHEQVFVNYKSQQPVNVSISQVLDALPQEEFAVVGHSLGGVIATAIAKSLPSYVTHLIAISAPLGGSRVARLLKWVPGSFPMLSDITPESPIIRDIRQSRLELPTLSVISVGGHLPVSLERNDGVVSVASQKALPFGDKVEIDTNHFEILQDDRTVNHIKNFIFTK
jgi:pimeloyl-ACP methyl ester carboxylesterase